MKIGILSMQMVPNYGSILQALALKTEMERRGHDVYFVDILPGRQVVTANAAAFDPKSKFDKYMLRRIENLLLERRMRRIFEKDRKTLLAIDKILPKGERFDLVIIGSDEVFNAATPSPTMMPPKTPICRDVMPTISVVAPVRKEWLRPV